MNLARIFAPLLAHLLLSTAFAEEPIPLDPAVRSGKLDNGLTWYVRQNPKPENRLELRLAVNAGSILEDDDQQGLAHLLEHMAFNGTEHFEKQELVQFLESLGVGFGPDLNAYTSFDETVYQLKVPTTDTNVIETGFLILADWAARITNADEELASERNVVIEERRGRRGAEQRIRDLMYPVLFHDSRYANRLPIGTLEVLETFDFDRLRAFYRDWYRPDLMAVVAVGDVDPDWLEAAVKRHFSGLAPAETPRPRPTFDHPDAPGTFVGMFSDPELTEASLSVFWKMPASRVQTRTEFRERLLGSLVAAMLDERLAELSRKADAPFLHADAYRGGFTRGGDVFGLFASVRDEPGAHLLALRRVLEEAERARKYGFLPGELDRARARILRNAERTFHERDSTDSVAFVGSYVRHFLEGNAVPGAELNLELHRELLAGISLEETNQRLDQWMSSPDRVVLGDGPSREGTTYLPGSEAVQALVESFSGDGLEPWTEAALDQPLVAELPAAGTVVKKEWLEKLDLHVWTLSNGVRVLIKPTEFKKDQVLLRAWAPGGTTLADDEEYRRAAAAAGDMDDTCGLGAFSAVDLQKKLAGKLVSLDASVEELRQDLVGSTTPDEVETLLQLVYLQFQTPRADPDAFAAYRQSWVEQVRNQDADPRQEFGLLMTETMSSYHPRYLRWTTNQVLQVDMDEALAFKHARFSDADAFTFLLVGSLDLETLEGQLAQWIASLPVQPGTETWRDPGVKHPRYELRRVLRRGLEPIGQVAMIWSRDSFEWSYGNRHRVNSLVEVLRIRLREEVREKLGGTYHVSVSARMEQFPSPQSSLSISFGCDPEMAERLIETVLGVVEEVKRGEIADKDLASVQETQRRDREVRLKQNEFWASVLPYYDWNGEDPHIILDFDRYVDALSAEVLQQTALECFGVPDQATFLLLPEPAPEQP